MKKAILTIEGKEYNTVRYDKVRRDDYFIDNVGFVYQYEYDGPSTSEVLIVVPVPVKHVFGGVPFEETGEVRFPRKGEWHLNGFNRHSIIFADFDYDTNKWPILRPVVTVKGDC